VPPYIAPPVVGDREGERPVTSTPASSIPQHARDPMVTYDPVQEPRDIPEDVRRELMAAATSNGRISFHWLCDLYRRGKGDARRQMVENGVVAMAESDYTGAVSVPSDDFDIGGRIVGYGPDRSWIIENRAGRRRRVQFLCADCGAKAT
jgi:hypothetical protein